MAVEDGRAGEDTSYEVIISAEAEQVFNNLKLLEGMTASVDVIMDRRSDVLYVPLAALRNGRPPTVEVVNGNTTALVKVVPGLKNRFLVEIQEGLHEGDTVRVNLSRANSLAIEQAEDSQSGDSPLKSNRPDDETSGDTAVQ